MRQTVSPILVGALLGALLYLLGALFSGAGHDPTAMTCFFPYGMTTGLLLEDGPLEFIGGILLVLQFPLYAMVYADVESRERGWVVIFILVAAHIAVAVIGLNVDGASEG